MKTVLIKYLVCCSFALVLVGCVGRNFVRPAPGDFVLGKTTMSEITARFGTPFNKAELQKNGQKVVVLNYAFATHDWGSLKPAREQSFSFYQDKLVGYGFWSSFKNDNTDFDGTKVAQLKTNVTTRVEVEQLLGPPGARCIYPVTPNQEEEEISYLYRQTRGVPFGVKIYTKSLFVIFNRQGIVRDVEYKEVGEK